MLDFKTLLLKQLKENRRSMGRFVDHILNDPYVIIMSVERSPYEVGRVQYGITDEELARKKGEKTNYYNTINFRTLLRRFKCGFITVSGSYIEEHDDNDVIVNERSTIIYCTEDNKQQLYDFCVEWAKKTNQDSILIIEKGRGKYYYPQINKFEDKGMFYPDQIGEYYTILHRNKKFTFTTKEFNITRQLKKMLEKDDNGNKKENNKNNQKNEIN